MGKSDEFSSRWGLIFATIGAAIGTGNIWRFPRMVGANGGGTFLIPWLFFLFIWSIPLVIAEFALGKRSRTGTVGTFRIFGGKNLAWMGMWTAWISCAIGFYYAVVAGWAVDIALAAHRASARVSAGVVVIYSGASAGAVFEAVEAEVAVFVCETVHTRIGGEVTELAHGAVVG